MKFKAFTLLTVIALAVALMGTASPVSAVAYGTSFVTSITYMNVGTGTATITLTFYAENSGTPILINLADLPMNAGSSIYVGGVSQVAAGFKGSAVMSSDQPLAATMVQLAPAGSTVKNRPLSNGFSGGASYVLIPTALKQTFSTNSVISIQNVDTVGADLEVKFVPVSGSTVTQTVTNLPSGAAKYFDLNSLATLGAAFNGSVQITAKKTGTATPGAVVATSLEASVANDNVYAFEGVATASDKIYMPSAFCNYSVGINSAYAVQNTGAAPTNITVTYSNGNSETKTAVAGGAKVSLSGCSAGNPAGFIGSATITAPGGTIVAIGKIGGGGLSTAYVGVADGSAKLFVPYVRWTDANWTNGTRQRTNIAIQNVGTGSLAAGAITVKYYDRNGALVGTDSNAAAVPVGGKFSSNARNTGVAASEFGYYGTATGGSAVVEGPVGSKLAVVARVATYINATTSVGEDYNGIP